MKLYSHKVAAFSRPITLFAAQNNLDADIVEVDVFGGECKSEAFTNVNRSKQIPVLEDDGFWLTECAAILKYLADKIDSPDYPKDLNRRARVNEAMDWINTGFYREFGYNMIYPQLLPDHKRQTEEVNRATVEWGREKSRFWLQVLDQRSGVHAGKLVEASLGVTVRGGAVHGAARRVVRRRSPSTGTVWLISSEEESSRASQKASGLPISHSSASSAAGATAGALVGCRGALESLTGRVGRMAGGKDPQVGEA